MTPEQLAELEMHLAAGTDLPTAIAAMDDRPRKPAKRDNAFLIGMLIGTVLAVAFILWLCA